MLYKKHCTEHAEDQLERRRAGLASSTKLVFLVVTLGAPHLQQKAQKRRTDDGQDHHAAHDHIQGRQISLQISSLKNKEILKIYC